MRAYDLKRYDGVLAFGDVIRDLYLKHGWARDAWTWHEAADPAHYRPLPTTEATGDLVWIGNWGDGERTGELERFFFEPVRRLELDAAVCGVNYPDAAIRRLEEAGAKYLGWASASDVVKQYARHRATVHVPRRFYARELPGIPTIRVFEALACGIPLVCSPWDDAEGLFAPGADYLVAEDSDEMTEHLASLLSEPEQAHAQAERGRQTILARHTCAHRVDELEAILEELGSPGLRQDVEVAS
jgi:spore maturation protein CgeB